MGSVEDINEVLKGKTLLVYHYMLRKSRPLSVREVQAGLRFKTPSQAFYHLNRLQSVGLIELQKEGYVVKGIYLKHYTVISKLISSRFIFYFVFFAIALLIELLILKPEDFSSYLFSVAIMFLGTLLFLYETIRTILMK
ncbi:MAG: hypothetical protein QXN75_01530 [Thermoproteota archaeon]|nr:helix-turn-helix transcriptional regulator [Candidatus Brockarchaeota archaeon]